MSLNTRNLSDLEEIDRFEQAIASFNAGESILTASPRSACNRARTDSASRA